MGYDKTTGEGQKRLMAESMGLDSETYIPQPITVQSLKIGGTVEYNDLNLCLSGFKGTLVSLNGKFCQVKWNSRGRHESYTAQEWIGNLRIATFNE